MKERTPRVLGARASPELEIDVASTHIITIISGIQIFLLFLANFKLGELGINSWLENISHTHTRKDWKIRQEEPKYPT